MPERTCDLSGIPMSLPEALAIVQRVADTHALTPCEASCVCGACYAPALPADPDGLCGRCRVAGCAPLLGLAYCHPKEDPNADLD